MEKRNCEFAGQLRRKQQASASLPKTKMIFRIGQALLITGLGFAGFVAADWPQEMARAQEVATNRVATGSTWQGASFPVENFQAYTSPFGYRQSPSGYSEEFHHGLDMAAPEGSYVRSWWNGTVVEVSDDSACGTSVVIQSGEWEHIYCHMQGHVETANGKRYMVDREGGLQMSEGQQVVAGTRIGRVGMTGRTTGPHLHWGMKYSGQWVDPALVLRAMYAQQVASGAVSSRPN